MTTAQQGASGGGLFSKLVVVLLLAVAIGLYLRIVMVEGHDPYAPPASAPQASVQVIESTSEPAAEPQALPADQMQLIKQVFAPELLER